MLTVLWINNFADSLSLRFNGHFPVKPGLAGVFEAKDDGGGGDNWTTGAISRAKLQKIITNNKPTSSFLQAGFPSCRPTNSVKALKEFCRLHNK